MSSEIRINVRTTAQIKHELEITAKSRGMTVSSLINSLAVKVIREEKLVEPEVFEQAKREQNVYEKISGQKLAPHSRAPIKIQKSSGKGGKTRRTG